MDGAPTPSERESHGPHGDAARLTWVLVDGRSGDDAQIVRIAEALGWPYRKVWAKRSVAETVMGRVQDAFGAFPPPAAWLPEGGPPAGPWPDLVLAAGGRNVSFARRIKRASGGRTRIVFLGA
ncbi:MAG: ELM1/GtrOC1 family putative glycosyltransferase, partial [Alphaproteobacteria bacterium]